MVLGIGGGWGGFVRLEKLWRVESRGVGKKGEIGEGGSVRLVDDADG